MARLILENFPRLNLRELGGKGGHWGRCEFLGEVRGATLDILEENLRVARVESPTTGAQLEIRLARTSCHFGNSRLWFVCPGCRQRRRVLFFVWDRFACRKCHGLAHRTQQKGRRRRMLLKADRILNRLGSGIGMAYPPKPKGMRLRTYERLRQAASRAQAAALYTAGGRRKEDW